MTKSGKIVKIWKNCQNPEKLIFSFSSIINQNLNTYYNTNTTK